MILLTVGTQLPFDRLIKIVDDAAPQVQEDIVAQIGKGRYIPKNLRFQASFDPTAFDALLKQARVVVGHAGIGTVLKAQEYRLPIILFPRRAAFKEHRNEHQLATASVLEGRSGIYVAHTGEQLVDFLSRPLEPPVPQLMHPDRTRLNQALFDYIMQA
ncbi:glycosyltransferase [Sphingobium sp.]|uniref:glycosyltransferase n=1 Tax=Sphingobium sp. TaxID=1912891 RepID=UPI003BB560FE